MKIAGAFCFSDMDRSKLSFYTQYSQFYIVDPESPADTGALDFWTTEAFDTRLAQGEGVLGVATECYGPVKGEIIFIERVNDDFDAAQFDHIVEGGINITSGKLQVWDCPGCEVQFERTLTSGKYRVRVYSSNLDTVDGDEGDDFYQIEIWPDDHNERKVLKQYN